VGFVAVVVEAVVVGSDVEAREGVGEFVFLLKGEQRKRESYQIEEKKRIEEKDEEKRDEPRARRAL